MPSNQALSDDQVAGELRKMVEFIKKEADEKAKEIELKANEEYEIEKANIVRSETAAIDELYEKKYKQASLAQQIAKSTVLNKTRLKVLEAREDVLEDVFATAASKLKDITKEKKKYKKVLEGLIEEGAFALMESKIVVRVKASDVAAAESVTDAAAKFYKEKSGKDVEIIVDKDHPLPDSISGGVVVEGSNGKIDTNNTLEERLKLLSEEALPAIRLQIFGPSTSRKFFD
ncbi:hypothetical protein DV451_003601 [Geotrichum candidum]|uniref:Similar to Saccharomyces cerevisiae YOR332W VMA4 Subunit E of the eight-subunit V1 peripheral membrane domain of the vacuolar H+-ATPase (V-ATPase) n=1 Tax=Geotrichum candidum TaxID=1173061 RepID=A0A0J9XAK2_GEOCN|nr:hypothetical protein DV451_003601 [Geotrichum candidum]KAF5105553.1 hypothetical protein DV453_004709 [Geotrichum candidum]KAF5108548.1 hypothetical protein DV454_005125 [Geotrichum candidum]KAF5113017.1 hypothetical protein DV452_003820 [Geotrichum candidum]KAF5126813.1 hypothetical protein DV495_003202 [Geotrichum candidum]